MSSLRPIVILGPTAGGKSDLAVGLARTLDGEILGADSMQVYRHMDAGTAKPSLELRAMAPHHLIDIVEPTERFTVADWLDLAEPLIESLIRAGKRPILVGGTNLYLKALIEGMFEGPEGDPKLREELAKLTSQDLHVRLAQVDPASAQRIHPNDMRKLVRAGFRHASRFIRALLSPQSDSHWCGVAGRSDQSPDQRPSQGHVFPGCCRSRIPARRSAAA